jgi:hypothetical protein
MNGPYPGARPLVVDGLGERVGDVELRISHPIPGNALTRRVAAFVNRSVRPVPEDMDGEGFSHVEFANQKGATWVTLHLSAAGESSERANAESRNMAVLQLRGRGQEPELTVFDTAQGRIGAERTVKPTSLDDPHSAAAKVLRLAPGLASLGVHAAGAPAIGSTLAAAFPKAVHGLRRQQGKSADRTIRIAKLETELGLDAKCFRRTRRNDRVFDPPPRGECSVECQWQHVVDMMDNVRSDLAQALEEFDRERRASGRSVSMCLRVTLHVEASWTKLLQRSLDSYHDNRSWPHGLRLLAFDDGPDQYVREVGSGIEP